MRTRVSFPLLGFLGIAAIAAAVVGCKGKEIANEAKLIQHSASGAIEAAKAGRIDAFGQHVGMIDGAAFRLKRLEAEEVEGVATATYLSNVRKSIVAALDEDWASFERAFLGASDRFAQITIIEFLQKTDPKRAIALQKKLESRPRILVRGASSRSAEQVVKKYQASHPHLRWLPAEGPRAKDGEAKVALILDFEENDDVRKLITYETTDAAGRKTGGPKRHALSGYGVRLTVRWMRTKAPDGLDDPTVFVAAKDLGQPKEFRGSGKTSAASKFVQHQAQVLTKASAELHDQLTERFLKEIAPRVF